jgi:hypothetical protein
MPLNEPVNSWSVKPVQHPLVFAKTLPAVLKNSFKDHNEQDRAYANEQKNFGRNLFNSVHGNFRSSNIAESSNWMRIYQRNRS